MAFHWDRTVINKILDKIFEGIDSIDNSILKGAILVASWIAIVIFIVYFILWQSMFNGHWLRGVSFVGGWVLIEFFNWMGGGHDQ